MDGMPRKDVLQIGTTFLTRGQVTRFSYEPVFHDETLAAGLNGALMMPAHWAVTVHGYDNAIFTQRFESGGDARDFLAFIAAWKNGGPGNG